ncbi:MAG: putative Ig domain-containing protein, partial [Bacteroidota bacterium]
MMKQYLKNVVVKSPQIITKFYFFILVFISCFITTTVNAQYHSVSACQGDTVTLLGPVSLHPGDYPNITPIGWRGPNDFTSTTANITLPNTNTVGTNSYYFDLMTQEGVSQSLQYVVTIKAKPNVTVSGNTTISCAGSTILTASGANSYVWSLDNTPIDNPSLVTALGLHKLVNSYNGPCLRLKRSSDGAEMDFGFVGNDLDKNGIQSWLSVAVNNQAQCIRLYDQSGHNGDVTYNGEDFRGPILSFNSIGRPVLHFNTSQTLFNAVNYPAPFTVVYGAQQTGGSRRRVLSSPNDNWILGYWNNRRGQALFNNGWVNSPFTPADDNFYIYTGTSTGFAAELYENGTLLASNGGGSIGPNGIQLNGWQGVNGLVNESSDVNFADVMIFNNVLDTTQRNNVENTIRNYYGTGAVVTVYPHTTTTYSVAGTDSVTGCNNAADIIVTVNSNPPTIDYGTVNNSYFVDKPVLITTTSTGTGNVYTISPQLPLGLSINAITGIISGKPTVLSPSTTYTITLQNNCGSATTQISFETVCTTQPPTVQALTTMLCPGSVINLTVTGDEVNYLWSTGATTRFIPVSTAGTYTVTCGSSQCRRTSTPITFQNRIIPGNPTIFGDNQWNVYNYKFTQYDTTSDLWSTNYLGFYTDTTSLDFNTQDKWYPSTSPSFAAGYGGCSAAYDLHSWSAKRQGFPLALYSIDIDSHDDRAELWVNNTKVWEHTGCCDSHSNAWQGVLGNDDKVEFRGADDTGSSLGAISFHTDRASIISVSGPTTICQGASVTLTAPIATGYLWSNGATTRAITVNTTGSYTVQVSIDGSVFTNPSAPTVVTVNPVPVTSITGTTSIACGDNTILTTSGAD